MTIQWKTVESRQTFELAVTILAAILVAQVYTTSPLLFTLLLSVAVVTIPILLKKPEYVAVFLVILLPFRDIHLVSILYVKRVLIWGGLAYILLRHYNQPTTTPWAAGLRRFTFSLALFLVAFIISLLQTVAAMHTMLYLTPTLVRASIFFYGVTFLDELALLYLVYYSMSTVQHVQRLIDAILATSAGIAVLGILQYIFKGQPPILDKLYDPELEFYGRVTSVFSNPNEFGAYIALMAVLTVFSLLLGTHSYKKRLGFYLPIVVLDWIALFLSFSRGALIQTLLSMVCIGMLSYTKLVRKKLSWQLLGLAAVGMILAGGALPYYDLYMRARIGFVRETEYQKALYYTHTASDSLRPYVAMRAIQTFMQHPVLGVGFDLFANKQLAMGLSPHNQFLKILSEMGLVGFLPFLAMLVFILHSALKGVGIASQAIEDKAHQRMLLLLLSGVASIGFSYLFMDALMIVPVTGHLWLFSGTIFMLEREAQSRVS